MKWFGVLKDFVSDIFNSISDTISGVFTAISDVAGSVGDFFGVSGSPDGTVDSGIGRTGASAKINQENTYNIYTNDGNVAGRTAAGMTDQNLRETREYFERGGM